MIEGFWIAQFEGLHGRSGAVLFLVNGKVFGGNSGHTLTGTYEYTNSAVKAQVKVEHFLPGVPNAWGMSGDFELQVTGTVQWDIIKGMAVLQAKGMGIPVKLIRRAPLPLQS